MRRLQPLCQNVFTHGDWYYNKPRWNGRHMNEDRRLSVNRSWPATSCRSKQILTASALSFNAVDIHHAFVHLQLPQWQQSKTEGILRLSKSYQPVHNFHTFNSIRGQAVNFSKSTQRGADHAKHIFLQQLQTTWSLGCVLSSIAAARMGQKW